MTNENLYTNYLNNIQKLNAKNILFNNIDELNQFIHQNYQSYQNLEKNSNEQYGITRNSVSYHSKRDPERESSRQIEEAIKKDSKHVIFCGAGLGYLLPAALNHNTILSVLLIEPDPEIFFYLISLINEDSLFFKSDKKIYLYCCIKPNDDLETILPYFQSKVFSEITIFNHRPSFQAYPERYTSLKNTINKLMEKRAVNQATIIKFQDIWNKNIILNSFAIFQGRTLNDFIQKFHGQYQNIIIAGAGPSLHKSFNDLRLYRNQFLLIAADTAYIPLVKNKIIPDLVLASDPQFINGYYVHTPVVNQSIWILDPVVCYLIPHFLQKNKATMYWWNNPFYYDKILQKYSGDRGNIAHGGSVSTNAFDLAAQLNPEKIILVGQDLSFPDNTAHTKGAALEEKIFFKYTRFYSASYHNHKQMTALEPVKYPSIQNENNFVKTNAKLKIFIEWFEHRSLILQEKQNLNIINASVSGVKLKHFKHIQLKQIFSNSENRKSHNIEVSTPAINSNLNNFIDELKTINNDIKKLNQIYQNSYITSQNLKKNLNSASAQNLILQLDKNDKMIGQYYTGNHIISIEAQSIILNINEAKSDLLNNQTYFYKSMYLAATKINYLISKIIKSPLYNS